MIPLAQLSRSARLTVRLLWVVGIGGLATFALAAAFDLGDTRGSGLQILYTGATPEKSDQRTAADEPAVSAGTVRDSS